MRHSLKRIQVRKNSLLATLLHTESGFFCHNRIGPLASDTYCSSFELMGCLINVVTLYLRYSRLRSSSQLQRSLKCPIWLLYCFRWQSSCSGVGEVRCVFHENNFNRSILVCAKTIIFSRGICSLSLLDVVEFSNAVPLIRQFGSA